jgi:hypothetical protein
MGGIEQKEEMRRGRGREHGQLKRGGVGKAEREKKQQTNIARTNSEEADSLGK